jgi:hypothetical protein
MTAMIFSTSCSKSKPPAAQAAVNQDSDQTNPAATVQTSISQPSATAAPADQPGAQPDLGVLNRALIRWIVGNRRPPANFEDFAATAGVTIPPPPAGKKYIIAKNMHIQLVDR